MIPIEEDKLKPTGGGRLPVRMVFIDTETKQVRQGSIQYHRMDLGWTCFWRRRSDGESDKKTWKYWESSEKLCHYLADRAAQKTVLYLFGHNIFFDLQVSDFYYYFTKWGWVLDFIYDQGLTYILSIHKGSRRIRCLSTTNYFDQGVKKLGQLVGLKKLDVDFGSSSRDDLKRYCRRDVEIIVAAMEEYFSFIEEHDLGSFGYTKSSQAFKAYRHRFLTHDIYLHRSQEIRDLERSGYFGGRTECFRFGLQTEGPFTTLDINSLYPYVMEQRNYPTRLAGYHERPSIELARELLQKYLVVARVDLETEIPRYATRRKGKTMFPVGRVRTTVCSEGLRRAIEAGEIVRIHEMSTYHQGPIFRDYVRELYRLRQHYKASGNAIMEKLVKYLLNSLYGKFGQKQAVIMESQDITYAGYYREEVFDAETGKTEVLTKLLNKRWITLDEIDADKSFPAIAAHVTEYGRMLLWDIIQGIGRFHVLYSDTDSVKIRSSDLDRVQYPIDAYQLGALKNEGETDYLAIYGAKHYYTENGRKIKGVPRSATKIAPGQWEYDQFLRQPSHLRDRIWRAVEVKRVVKKVPPYYDKGIVQKNGAVTPYTVFDF